MRIITNSSEYSATKLLSLLCLLALIREWTIPFDLTDGLQLLQIWTYILIAIGVVELIVPMRSVGFLVCLAGFLIMMNKLYYDVPLFKSAWIRHLFTTAYADIFHMYHQEWSEVKAITVFFLVCAVMIISFPLLRYLIVKKGWGISFFLLTGAYLSTLDSFRLYDAKIALVRFLIIGFLMLASLELHRLEKISIPTLRQFGRRWLPIAVSSVLVGCTVGSAYLAPKYASSWPDPFTYFVPKAKEPAAAKPKPVTRVAKYSGNDRVLGGPLADDDDLVFIAVTSDKFYWRGDTKEIYTGTGWEKREHQLQPVLEPEGYKWPDYLFPKANGKEVHATLQFNDQYRFPQLFYPGQLRQVSQYVPKTLTIQYETDTGFIQAHDGSYDVFRGDKVYKEPDYMYLKMNEYSLLATIPLLDEAKLSTQKQGYPKEILPNLQLPKELPGRVKQLAQTITADSSNQYAKVKAVLSYLHDSGQYKYEKAGAQSTDTGRDFVDQFLFEDKRGYCDYFSTSMVVMLRSIGIPARWVKGFAPGKQSGMDSAGNYIMEIRNKDAHSWAEVYFAGAGWIPFEPTPTFTSPVQQNTSAQPAAKVNLEAQSETAKAVKPRLAPFRDEEVAQTSPILWEIGLGAGGAVFVGFIFWRKFSRIQRWWLRKEALLWHQHMPFREQFITFLAFLAKFHSPRGQHETVREYVNRLDLDYDEKAEIRSVTSIYEEMIYGLRQVEAELYVKGSQLLLSLVKKMKL